jgi:hypothetical protein
VVQKCPAVVVFLKESRVNKMENNGKWNFRNSKVDSGIFEITCYMITWECRMGRAEVMDWLWENMKEEERVKFRRFCT